MAARKKSGRLTLRMDSDVHARIAKTAKALGMDINGILNVLIRTGLPWYEALAFHVHDPKMATLLPRWAELNPISEATEFYANFRCLKLGESCFFDDGNWYQLRETADRYELIQVEPPGFMPASRAVRERAGLQPPTPKQETP